MTIGRRDRHRPDAPGLPGAERGGALEGVVVVELAATLAGEFATGLLADLGATVVKVERGALL